MLIALSVGILSQCIHISNHRVVHLIILFVNYISLKLKERINMDPYGIAGEPQLKKKKMIL